MTIGERIKQLRIEKGITQLDLANALYLTDRAISKWEQGRGNPDITIVPSIASYFGVSIDYLLTGEESVTSRHNEQNELILYFESMIDLELNSEYIQRMITKHLEKYSVEKIKNALDICYDTYLLKKEKPLLMEDVKDALSKLGGILYNNDLPAIDRAINRIVYYLQKNEPYYLPSDKKECERILRELVDYSNKSREPNDTNALEYLNFIYKQCTKNGYGFTEACQLFRRTKEDLLPHKKWNEIDTSSEHADKSPFAAIGNGRLKLSIGACRLIKDFNRCNYVIFAKAKKDRVLFVGLRFGKIETQTSFRVYKESDDEYGATIIASDLLNTLYGDESTSSEYTKHEVILDPANSDTLVVYYNYKKKYYIEENGAKKRIRTKRINTIIDKEWKILYSKNHSSTGKKYPVYIIKNINTGEEMEISTRALSDIEKGLTSVEKIKLCREIGVNTYRGKRMAAKKKLVKALKE